jgi:hypothetical protein
VRRNNIKQCEVSSVGSSHYKQRDRKSEVTSQHDRYMVLDITAIGSPNIYPSGFDA